MNYEVLLAFSMATFLLSLSPGPDNIFVLIQSMGNGKKYGLAVVAGLMTGCLVHTTLLAIGVSVLIKNNPVIFNMIRFFGSAYLIYLALMVYKSDDRIQITKTSVNSKSYLALYKQGFIMNVLNPKVTIFFLAFFPGFLFSETLSTAFQFYILGFLFIFISSIVFGGIALLSGQVSTFLTANERTGYLLKWLQIVVFVGIAIYLLFSW
ncbi:Threonine/homoserine/homoserine lactone efflux protein [Maribacter sedimenticola]|uniref:Threonine/homoserine/homoserine lactone efflux protein n=1 Tax=Maribacter sedimenticola TaxID=228956 RepID=A0ABY1SFA0_9FLAO|nr:LysE family translocator [Maribacter sedimenticola]SNR32044.1 Threonine/homoserine/homoserine lactone efflux protein [Maribacter sedimenticola]